MREALAIDEKYREPTHDFIAIRLNNLAHLLQETNRFSEAEQAIQGHWLFEKPLLVTSTQTSLCA